MIKRHNRTTLGGMFVLCCILNFALCEGARGQSPVVFMTAEDPSELYRFDDGVETFGVSTGLDRAFHGVTLLNGNVLVADFRGEAIQRFSPGGSLLTPFALFNNPVFLESDSGGNVYTTPFSIGPPIATRFNSAGIVTETYTHPNIRETAGVDADAAGNVYVVDGFGGTSFLFKFANDGTFINQTSLGSIAGRDIAIDEVGNRLYLADEFGGSNAIKVYNIAGAAPTLIGSITTPANTVGLGIHFAAESGNVLLTDFGILSNDPRGLEYSPTGVLLRQYRPAGINAALDITTFAIPEPSIMVLASLALLGLVANLRRSR